MTYTDKIIPGKPCPKCGGNLLVKTKKRRIRGEARPEETYFIGCANFFVRGCDHTEKFTDESRALIDNQPARPDDWYASI